MTKMTMEQTLEQFLIALNSNAYLSMCETSDMNNVIEALKKQIPEKPIEKDCVVFDVLQERDWFCPTCNVKNMISYGQPYCCECGQAIDWE